MRGSICTAPSPALSALQCTTPGCCCSRGTLAGSDCEALLAVFCHTEGRIADRLKVVGPKLCISLSRAT